MGSQRVGHDWVTSTLSREAYLSGFLQTNHKTEAKVIFFCFIPRKLGLGIFWERANIIWMGNKWKIVRSQNRGCTKKKTLFWWGEIFPGEVWSSFSRKRLPQSYLVRFNLSDLKAGGWYWACSAQLYSLSLGLELSTGYRRFLRLLYVSPELLTYCCRRTCPGSTLGN